MKKPLIQWLGLLGVISLLSYTAAVVFSPLAYPGYRWTAQAVSDLFAVNAPSTPLWNQLSALYGVCGMVSVMMACVYVGGRLNRLLRLGVYLFAAMYWVSSVGYAMFPLTESGRVENLQNFLHVYVVTGLVVLLSVVSLLLIAVGGFRNRAYPALAGWAAAALLLMLAGAVGTAVLPAEWFGIPERFSLFAAAGFNAALGIVLFWGFAGGSRAGAQSASQNRDKEERQWKSR